MQSVLANNSGHYHPAINSVFDTNILLSHAIYPTKSLCSDKRKSRARLSTCIDYIIDNAVLRPWTGLLSRNLNPRKLILRAFSDFLQKLVPPKIIHHMVYRSLAKESPLWTVGPSPNLPQDLNLFDMIDQLA